MRPMLSKEFNKMKDNVQYPVYVQPKMDGIRCLAHVVLDSKGKSRVKLYTRNLKAIEVLPTIVSQLKETFESMKDKMAREVWLDGELYSPNLFFEDICSIVKRKTIHERESAIELHVFDYITDDMSLKERLTDLDLFFAEYDLENVKPVAYYLATNEQAVETLFNQYKDEGYEGVMVKTIDSVYEQKRSRHSLKLKEIGNNYIEKEFEIINVIEGKGKFARTLGAFQCRTEGGRLFNCGVFKFDIHTRNQLWAKRNVLEGQFLTVQYDRNTSGGVPRFPRGIRVRNDVKDLSA